MEFKCVVCGYSTKNGAEITKHRSDTGHTYRILKRPKVTLLKVLLGEKESCSIPGRVVEVLNWVEHPATKRLSITLLVEEESE